MITHRLRRAAVAVLTAVAVTTTALPAPALADKAAIVNHVDARTTQDTVFVIDTTASMSDDIAAARAGASRLAREILSANPNSRIAVIEYRDYHVPFPTSSGVTSARVVTHLTGDEYQVQQAIGSLRVADDDSVDKPEDMLSGIRLGLAEDFRGGSVARNIIVIGDAPAHNPECPTGLTWEKIEKYLTDSDADFNADNLINAPLLHSEPACQRQADPTNVAPAPHIDAGAPRPSISIVEKGYGALGADASNVAGNTGGGIVSFTNGTLADNLTTILDDIGTRPTARLTVTADAYEAGRSIQFSAEGSEVVVPGPAVVSIDFGDGSTPAVLSDQLIYHRYTKAGTYKAVLTVTDAAGHSASATRTLTIGEDNTLFGSTDLSSDPNEKVHGRDDDASSQLFAATSTALEIGTGKKSTADNDARLNGLGKAFSLLLLIAFLAVKSNPQLLTHILPPPPQ